MGAETTDRLATVLYLLMRDELPVGAVTRAVRYIEQPDAMGDPAAMENGTRWRLSNEPLAGLAESLAERIRGGT